MHPDPPDARISIEAMLPSDYPEGVKAGAMQRDADESSAPMPLDYAAPVVCRHHSFFSVLAAAMAALTVGWLSYVEFVRPLYRQGGPFWQVLWEWNLLPGSIALLLAIAGLVHAGRKRWLSVVVIVVVVLAYVFLNPPRNFA